MLWSRVSRTGIVIMALLLSGCGSTWYYTKGIDDIEHGKVDEGLATLQKGIHKYPRDTQLRAGWLNQKFVIVENLLVQGDRALAADHWDEATAHYQHAAQLDPGNERAAAGLAAIAAARRHAQLVTKARALLRQGKENESEALLRRVLAENPNHADAKALEREIDNIRVARTFDTPTLNTLYHGPVTLELRDTNIKMALEILSKTSGVSFALDKDIRPDLAITLFVQRATLEEAVNLMLSTYHLKKRILNDKTVLIYPDTPNKKKEYEELAVKAFYLTNVDANKMSEIIRTFLKTRDIIIEPRLNMLILRDSIDSIRAVEKLVALVDVPEPEVMLEVEVLEVQSSRLHDLGIQFPDQVTLNVLSKSSTSTTDRGLTLDDLKDINGKRIGVSGISASLNLKRELSNANILANPSIRVRNREKATIRIGDRLPVITTTQNVTSNSASDNVQYQDVGLNLQVEPDVRMDNEVAIKLGLEVSSVVKEVRGGFGSIAYQIGTRDANTVLRLRDGETQILGGLIRHDETQVSNRVPGLGDLPLLGHLFSSDQNQKNNTEIVLAITPHILRNVVRPQAAEGQFWSGTEDHFTLDQPWGRSDSKKNPSPKAPGGSTAPEKTAPSSGVPTQVVP